MKPVLSLFLAAVAASTACAGDPTSPNLCALTIALTGAPNTVGITLERSTQNGWSVVIDESETHRAHLIISPMISPAEAVDPAHVGTWIGIVVVPRDFTGDPSEAGEPEAHWIGVGHLPFRPAGGAIRLFNAKNLGELGLPTLAPSDTSLVILYAGRSFMLRNNLRVETFRLPAPWTETEARVSAGSETSTARDRKVHWRRRLVDGKLAAEDMETQMGDRALRAMEDATTDFP